MLHSITLLMATPIVKAILSKFCEDVGSKLGENLVEKLPDVAKQKVQQLRQLVWEKCLRGKPDTDYILQQAANGSINEQRRLTQYLHKVLSANTTLKQQIQPLVAEIWQVIQVDNVDAINTAGVCRARL